MDGVLSRARAAATVLSGKRSSLVRIVPPLPETDAGESTVARRRFGATDVELSEFTFGSARMLGPGFDARSAAGLITAIADRGVTTFHVSHEYESYPLFCQAFGTLRRSRPTVTFEIIAKIAVPHFDEQRFSEKQFRRLIEDCIHDLGVERVDVVQWLVRHTPNEDRARLNVLSHARDAVGAAWERLRSQGKVGALGIFPYSDAFLRECLTMPCVDGVVSYLNLLERELVPYLDDLSASKRGVIAIRPLAAGRLIAERDIATSFPLVHPAVASVVMGVSSKDHLEAALSSIAKSVIDPHRFHELARTAELTPNE